MADQMRWRYGDTRPVVLAVAEETVIEIGDLVWLDTDNARPAVAIDDIGGEGPASLAAAQEDFHDKFAGVAMQRSPAGSSRPIRVATSGVFELDAASATFEVGDLVGVAQDSEAARLAAQRGVAVPTAARAIGRVAKRVVPAGTHVLVEIVGTVSHGGPQAAA